MRVGLVVGTRPEAIKLAPVYQALRDGGDEPTVVLTGQQGAILDPLLRHFALDRRIELGLRGGDERPERFFASCLDGFGELFREDCFDLVLVQGDTSSAAAGALAAFHARVPLGHVEAGLRTHDLERPFPEEGHRQLIARFAAWHFAPTASAARNLAREKVGGVVETVGNTVVDAALWTACRHEMGEVLAARFPELAGHRYVLVTAHRRESFGAPMRAIGEGLRRLAVANSDRRFFLPLHPNPNAREPLLAALEGLPNVMLAGPQPYDASIALLAGAEAVITDSGGLQEEAPSFGVPILVLRDVTERPEAVAAGFSQLVGTDPARLFAAFERIRSAPRPDGPNPFGDGRSGERIAANLRGVLAERALAC